ncbi:DHHW family protein [Paenibacillus gallinarum]|uniref:Preprotein translocase n=1 Tax=Paenibacillus gallinarum TaxID=2762232 RepID=A0ABR8T189_9BACL|nr:DHHW family protein [Paenibacillus gallinarum]MBD7969364.1 preprotein translocase [Paenibacillus gallinarum]
MDRKRAVIVTSGFLLFISCFGMWSLWEPDRTLSEFENRVLAKFPSFSWDKLWSGRYTDQLDDYLVDQFVGRDNWVGLKSDMERMSGKTENNQVFFGSSGYLFERFTYDEEQLGQNIKQIARFAERHQKDVDSLSLLLVPNSQTLNGEYLPKYAEATDAPQSPLMDQIFSELSGRVAPVDIREVLQQKKSTAQIYYRTDHHWTTRGAYYGYQAFADTIGLSPTPEAALEAKQFSDSFYGTFYTKANQRNITPDHLELLETSLQEYEVCIEGQNTCKNSFYDLNAQNERDKYKVFFGGNYPLVTINIPHEEANKDRSIIVFKDSYANAMVPFLAQHYSTIHMIDMRYFRMDVDEYLEEHHFDDMLLLYSVATIAQEDIFKWLN